MSLLNTLALKQVEKRRMGRGPGSGRGKTAGRGTKGQKSRTGFNLPRRFEGGQNSLIGRLPKKKGFQTNKVKNITLRIGALAKFNAGDIVSPKSLYKNKLISDVNRQVKIVDGGDKVKGLRFQGLQLSKSIAQFYAKSPAQKADK